MKSLTEHSNESPFDLIDLAELPGVSIGHRAKDRRGHLDPGSMSVAE